MKTRGISLIVLVITIIVIVILATAVIVTVVQNNPIAKAKEAVLKGDVKEFEVDLNLALANEKLNDYNFEKEGVNAYEIEDIKKYIPSFTDKYYGKLCIEQGRLCFVSGNVTEEEKSMLEASGIQKGSYITKDQIDDILSKASNIPADATTTDITEYIDGISPEQAEKFTIFQGNLYYRWEKTNMAERKMLYSLSIPFLAGDVNADGTLTSEDVTMVEHYNALMEEEYNPNLFYIGDVNYDAFVDTGDANIIESLATNSLNISNVIDISKQNPDRVKFIGDYLICDYGLSLKDEAYDDPNINLSKYEDMKKYIPNITREQKNKISIIRGTVVYRYETLSEEERTWIYEYGILFNLGDVNFDGLVDDRDLNGVLNIVADFSQRTPVLEVLANIDGNLRPTNKSPLINTTDATKLKLFLKGDNGTYRDLITENIEKMNSY